MRRCSWLGPSETGLRRGSEAEKRETRPAEKVGHARGKLVLGRGSDEERGERKSESGPSGLAGLRGMGFQQGEGREGELSFLFFSNVFQIHLNHFEF